MPEDDAIIARLMKVAQRQKDPYAPFDPVPTEAEAIAATAQLAEIQRIRDERHARDQDRALAVERQQHEERVHEAQLRLDVLKAEQEWARIEVERVGVVVRAIEAAAKLPDRVQRQELVDRLIAGSEALIPAARRIEVKE